MKRAIDKALFTELLKEGSDAPSRFGMHIRATIGKDFDAKEIGAEEFFSAEVARRTGADSIIRATVRELVRKAHDYARKHKLSLYNLDIVGPYVVG